MGPAATIRLYEEITARTGAGCDQDHVPLLIDSCPQIPDRTSALLGGGPDPAAELLGSVRRLVAGGADFIAMACNTAHAWYDQVAAASPVPVLHLIRIAAESCRQRLPAGGAVGVLATQGTLASGLYQQALQEVNLRTILPDAAGQACVMQAILQVKAGGPENFRHAVQAVKLQAEDMIRRGSAVILLGCTDLSVILREGDLAVPIVDSTVALAERMIAIAKGERPAGT